MGPEFEKVINDLNFRMRMFRAFQEDQSGEGSLTEREVLILQQLAERGPLSVSQIAEAWPSMSDSTISMDITKLWRKKGLVTKTINPGNQRVTMVELSEKGKEELNTVIKQRNERFQMFFHAINVSEEEKQVLTHVFQRAVDFMDQSLGFSSHAPDTAK